MQWKERLVTRSLFFSRPTIQYAWFSSPSIFRIARHYVSFFFFRAVCRNRQSLEKATSNNLRWTATSFSFRCCVFPANPFSRVPFRGKVQCLRGCCSQKNHGEGLLAALAGDARGGHRRGQIGRDRPQRILQAPRRLAENGKLEDRWRGRMVLR